MKTDPRSFDLLCVVLFQSGFLKGAAKIGVKVGFRKKILFFWGGDIFFFEYLLLTFVKCLRDFSRVANNSSVARLNTAWFALGKLCGEETHVRWRGVGRSRNLLRGQAR